MSARAHTVEIECPHCEALMEVEYEMDQGDTAPLNAYQGGRSYWYLAWLDLPDACPDGCPLTDDKKKLTAETEERLLDPGDPY